jgi:hypothetical protein
MWSSAPADERLREDQRTADERLREDQRTADERLREDTGLRMSVRDVARKVFGGQWPILLVSLFLAAAFLLVAAGYWRRGALVMAFGVAAAAALRLTLREDRVGLLAVRSRAVDVLTTASVSAAMLYIAWTIDPLGTQ